ncbi:MAG: hypothetical protein ACYCS1_05270 [Gammaproteobacteria bacterium]
MDVFKILGISINMDEINGKSLISEHDSGIAYWELYNEVLFSYLENNISDIKKQLGIPKSFEHIRSKYEFLFEKRIITQNYIHDEKYLVTEDILNRIIPEEVKTKIIASVRRDYLNKIINNFSYGKYKDVLIYSKIYGNQDIEKIYNAMYNFIISESDKEFTWADSYYYRALFQFYHLTGDTNYKLIMVSVFEKAMKNFKRDFNSFNNEFRINYNSIQNQVLKFINYLRMYYTYSNMDSQVIIMAKPESYLKDEDFKIIVDFIINFKKNKRRLYQTLFETISRLTSEEKEIITSKMLKIKSFNIIMIKDMMTK